MRDIELELLPMFQYKGLGAVVWGPLAGGFLSGKYPPGQRVIAGTRSEEKWVFPDRFLDDVADEILETLLEVADELGTVRRRWRSAGYWSTGDQLRHRGRATRRAVARQPGRCRVAPAR